MSELLDFDHDLQPRTVPFRYQGRDYALLETTEAAAIAYEDAKEACFTRDDAGKIATVRGMGQTELLLLSLTVYPVLPSGPSKDPVPKEILALWPSRVCKPLFERALQISGLHPEETTETLEKKIAALQKQLEELKRPFEPAPTSVSAKS